MKHQDVTDRVIAAFYDVYNALGWGFVEKVYQKAMAHELRKRGVQVNSQEKIDVFYDGICVGEFYADMLVEGCVIVELKAVENVLPDHEVQLVNYLKATTVDVGLLLNFGRKPLIRRKIFETARKITSQPSEPVPF